MGNPCTNCIDIKSLLNTNECFTIDSDTVIYTGPPLPCSTVNTLDTVTMAIQKLDALICTLGAPQNLQSVLTTGNIATNIGAKFVSSINPLLYTEILYNQITSGAFIKIGGTSTEFLMADGSVNSSTFVTNLQQAYFGSTSIPQITVNDVLGALTLKTIRTLSSSTIQEWWSSTNVLLASLNGNGTLSITPQSGAFGVNINATGTSNGISVVTSGSGVGIISTTNGSVSANAIVAQSSGVAAALVSIASSASTTGNLFEGYNLTTRTSHITKEGFINAEAFIKYGGLGTEYLMADGTVTTNADIVANIVAQTIVDGDITHAPAGNAVFDALALKANDNQVIHNFGDETKTGTLTVTSIIRAGGLSTQFLKADGSIDTNTYALDANVVHKTGNESITAGNKTFSNTGGNAITVNMANPSGQGIQVLSSSSGNGIGINNTGSGYGIEILNSIGFGLRITNSSTGFGASISNNSSGQGLSMNNTSSGHAIVINGTPGATGLNILSQNNGSATFSVTKTGDVTANSFIKSGGLSTQFLKADGSVDSTVYAADANVLHTTGNESWTGIKSSTNTGATNINGLNLTNSGTSNTAVLNVSNSSSGYGIFASNSGAGGAAIRATTTNTGSAIEANSNGGSAGNAIRVTSNSSNIAVQVDITGTGEGIRVTNAASSTYAIDIFNFSNSAAGLVSNNMAAGWAAVFNNNGNGVGARFESALASTGRLIEFTKNGTLNSFFDQNGRYTIVGGTSAQFLKADGTIDSTVYTNNADKQNSLVYDGTGVKFPTVDAVNNLERNVMEIASKTGLVSKNDTYNMIALDNITARFAAVTSAVFWNELFVPSTAPGAAIRAFAQKDYPLAQLETASGGNVNITPITTNGKHVRYLGYDKLGNVYSSPNSFATNNDVLQLGFVTVLRTAPNTISFLDGAVGPRNVLAMPNLASNTDFDKIAGVLTNITVAPNTGASINTTNGTLKGISINWKTTANPSNTDPIDVFNYIGSGIGVAVAFRSINPLFLNGIAALSTHTLWTELEDAIQINEKFFNTTTQLPGVMNNGTASVKRILVGIRGAIYVQDGEHAATTCYPDLATAKNNIFTHKFSEAILPPGTAFEIARVAYVKGATAFQNDTQFYLVNTAGGSTSSSTVIPPVSDATTVSKGIIQLSGDFDPSSTAALPIIKDATAVVRGLVNTGAQTFAGNKTFNGTINSTAFIKTGAPATNILLANGTDIAYSETAVDNTVVKRTGGGLALISGGYLDTTLATVDATSITEFATFSGSGTIRRNSIGSVQTALGINGGSFILNQNASAQSANMWISGNAMANAFYAEILGASSNGTNEVRLTTSTGGSAPLTFYTASSEKMRITSSGNVGIGTTNPLSRLTIAGALGGTVGAGGANLRIVNTDTGNYASIGAGIVGNTNSGMEFSLDGSTKMVIAGNGNVGIGTPNPTDLLEVNGPLRVNSLIRNKDGIWFLPNGTDRALLRAESGTGDVNLFQYDSGGSFLRTAISFINANGNVLIGTAADVGIKLHVAGQGYFTNGIQVGAISSSPFPSSSWIRADSDSTGIFLTNNSISKWAGLHSDGRFVTSGAIDAPELRSPILQSGAVIRKVFGIGGPAPAFGNGRYFVQILKTSDGSNFISGKITISGYWHYSPVMGIIELETGVYVSINSTQIDAGNSRIVSETGMAAYNATISDLMVVNGYVGFYIYSVDTNNFDVQFEGTITGPQYWNTTLGWESSPFPSPRGVSYLNKVGIGTTTPSRLLEIVSGNSTNNAINLKYSAGYGNTGFYTIFDSGADGGNVLGINVNNAAGASKEVMRLLGNGEVLLSQNANLLFDGLSNSKIGCNADNSNTNLFAGSTAGYVSNIQVSGGGTLSPNSIIFSTASTERMRIVNSGNVLIGTTTDNGYKLNINGGGYFNGPLFVSSDGHFVGRIQTDSGFVSTSSNSSFFYADLSVGYSTYQGYTFAVNGTGKFSNTLTASSGIVSGAHSTFQGAVGNVYNEVALEVQGNGSSNTIFPSISFHQPGVYAFTMSARNSGFWFTDISGGGNRAGIFCQTVEALGNIVSLGTVTATGFFTSSDERLKDIISKEGDMITFKWKDGRDDRVHKGYSAQKVQETNPDAVSEDNDGNLTVNYIEVLVDKIAKLEKRILELESKLK